MADDDDLVFKALADPTRRFLLDREKLHFLNPVPIRLIHDRWIDKYRERQVSALAELKAELEEEMA
jgi:DNA-binding transcriptional ArsR family regulator